MKISIITATFNSGRTVADTLESVLAQDYSDYELIVKDGGSRDNTLDICRSYEARFEGRLRIISEPDRGIYDAMNQGIAAATGDVVGILNSDDFYTDSHVLGKIADAMSDNTIGAVYGNLVFVDAVDTNKVIRTWKGSQHVAGGFLRGWHPAHPTFYARKKCFDDFGAFDITFNVSADFELMLRFLEANGIKSKYIDYCFVRMRQGGESTGSIKKIIEGNKNVLRAFKKNGLKAPSFYLVRRLAPKAINIIKTKLKL